MSGFAETLKSLAGVSHITAIELFDEAGNPAGLIENKPGQTGSLAVYNHLAQIYGTITPQAAEKGLLLYAEHTDDARARPGRHPNIDRLFEVIQRKASLRVKTVFALE